MKRLVNVPLREHTTLGVGGPARELWRLSCDEDVSLALGELAGAPHFVLGGGSNLLICDAGIQQIVLQLGYSGWRAEEVGGGVRLHISAGTDWATFCEWAAHEGLSGIECLAAIPGQVGATPIQNVGAYGQEVGDVLEHVVAIERATGERVQISKAECQFAYRHSAFKGAWKNRYLIVEVCLRLSRNPPAAPRYGELSRALGNESGGPSESSAPPTSAQIHDTVVALRRPKGMVFHGADPMSRSAGSFFTNPIVPESHLEGIRQKLLEKGRDAARMPVYPAGEGKAKLAAAWLIEQAGFSKGHRRGNAQISDKHALALVNCGSAKAAEVVSLARDIQEGVWANLGVSLEPEPTLVGFEDNPLKPLG